MDKELETMYALLRGETKPTDKIPARWQWTVWRMLQDLDKRAVAAEEKIEWLKENKDGD